MHFRSLSPKTRTPERRTGRLLFAGETDFVKGVVAMDGLPPPTGWKSALPGGPMSANHL